MHSRAVKLSYQIIAIMIISSFIVFFTNIISGTSVRSFFNLFVILTGATALIGIIKGLLIRRFLDFMSPYILFPLMYLIIYAPGTNEVIKLSPLLAEKMLGYLLTGFFMFLLGASFVSLIFLKHKDKEKLGPNTSIDFKFPMKVFYSIGIFAMLTYWIKSGGIPAFMADVENNRVAAISGNGIPFHLSMLTMVVLWYYYTVSDKFSFKRHGLLLIFTILILFSTGWRNTSVALIFIALAIFHYKKPVSIIKMSLVSVFLVVLISVSGLYRISSSTNNFELSKMMEQGNYVGAFFQYLYNYPVAFGKDILSQVLVHIPDALPFQHGKTFLWNFQLMIPGNTTEAFDFILKVAMNRGFDGGGMPPTLIGDLYINFNYMGIVFGMMLVGMLWSLFHHLFLRNPSNVIGLVSAIFIYYLSVSVRGGIENITLTMTWLIVVSIALYLYAHYRNSLLKRKNLIGRQSTASYKVYSNVKI